MDRKPAFAVALVGLGTSIFLAYEYLWAGEVACPVGGAGCDVVRLSQYSSVLGIPVPLMGIGFYLTLAVLEIIRSELPGAQRMIDRTMLAMAGAGMAFSAYLTALEAFVIGAYCFWCLVSAACTLALALLYGLGWYFDETTDTDVAAGTGRKRRRRGGADHRDGDPPGRTGQH